VSKADSALRTLLSAESDREIRRALDALPPDAILIDPAAPETMAALVGALDDSWQSFDLDADWDKAAAAVLPAFVARLCTLPKTDIDAIDRELYYRTSRKAPR
jgi:hypothetical protein